MRKLILKSVLCFICILSGIQVNAQFVYTGNTTGPAACDGYAYFADSIAGYTSITWVQSGNTISSDTNSVTGLCAGTYSITCTGSSTDADTTIVFTINEGTPCDNFYAYMNNTVPADPGVCNGHLQAGASGGLAPYSFTWSTGTTSQTLTGACSGTIYSVTVEDINGCSTTISGTVYEDSMANNPCNGFYANASVTLISSPNLCDGSATGSATGGTAPYAFSWSNAVNTPSIYGLCSGTYTLTVTDANGCTASVSATVYEDSTVNNPCSGFYANVSVTNISSPVLCDGSATATAVGGTAPYTYSWSNAATTATINWLCGGSYTLTITDANGCTTTGWANLYIDTTINVDSSLVIYTYPTNVSEDGECDGTVEAYAWGGSGTYTYVLDFTLTSSNGFYDSLCQGIHTICVNDSNGDSTICTDFIISNPSNNYNNPTYGDSVYVDSILGDLQTNCQLNYQGIDSVFITGYDIFGDSILVYWSVVTSTGFTTVTQLYYIGGGAGVYSLGLQVYCPGKALGNYFTATDQIYYGGPLGVEENTMETVSVYPNPASDVLNIQFGEAGDYGVTLYDLTGREIMSAQSHDADHLTVNVSTLAKGQYTLKITGKNGFMSKSILK